MGPRWGAKIDQNPHNERFRGGFLCIVGDSCFRPVFSRSEGRKSEVLGRVEPLKNEYPQTFLKVFSILLKSQFSLIWDRFREPFWLHCGRFWRLGGAKMELKVLKKRVEKKVKKRRAPKPVLYGNGGSRRPAKPSFFVHGEG